MKTAAAVLRVIMWIALVFSLACHGLALYGILGNNQKAVAANQPDAVFDLTLLYVGAGLLLLAVVLFRVLRRRPWLAVAVAAVAGVLFAVNTVKLGTFFPLSGVGAGAEHGMTVLRLLIRHWSIELVPICMALSWLLSALPGWRNVPEAVAVPQEEVPQDGPEGALFVRCAHCNAAFFNAASSAEMFRCPYCHRRLLMPGKSWTGLKKKRSVAARERKAGAAPAVAATDTALTDSLTDTPES